MENQNDSLLDALIPDVKEITKPYFIIIPTGTQYTQFKTRRPVFLIPTSAITNTLYWNPETQPVTDSQALQDSSGAAMFLYARGEWYVRHSEASNQTFRVIDAGGAGNAAAVGGAVGITLSDVDLKKIGGTTQTGTDVSSRYVPTTWGALVAAITVNAADTAVLAANTSRRALSVYNASTAGQVIALDTAVAATGINGFLILAAGTGYIFNPQDGTTTQAIRAWASAAGGSLIVREGT